jgi:hypothetical protein
MSQEGIWGTRMDGRPQQKKKKKKKKKQKGEIRICLRIGEPEYTLADMQEAGMDVPIL